ncbi:MAG: M48 family metalloprotease [Rhodanobacteraceae bacterium]
MFKSRCVTAILTASLAAPVGAREASVALPDIGSSAGTVMSPAEQRAYGANMLHELRSYGLVLDDPLLDDYINAVGYRLVAHSDRPDMSFTFFIVRDSEINAFAAPGGYIAANSGMIVAMQREDELAAILAHEISHITQQHLLRAFEDAQKTSIPMALAMLGAIIATSHRNDDSTGAAIVSGTSLIEQHQIDFTRHDEAEADHVGIQTLARAGYDPMAMADTFAALQRVMRSNGVDVPEFLMTHPVDIHRIADAKARAAQLGCPKSVTLVPQSTERASGKALNLRLPAPTTDLLESQMPDEASAERASDSSTVTVGAKSGVGTLPQVSVSTCEPLSEAQQAYFEAMRERARVLSADSPGAVLAYYAENLHEGSDFDTPANHYGFALALTRAHQSKRAVEELERLVAKHSGSSIFRLALADAEDQNGNHAGAEKLYDQLNRDFPDNHTIALAYADSLLARGTQEAGARAADLLRPLIDRFADDPDLQKSLGHANQLAGDKVRATEAYAEAAYLNGHAEDALNQLKALLKMSDLNYYQRARVDARITQLTPVVLELRHHGGEQKPDSLAPVLACCRK